MKPVSHLLRLQFVRFLLVGVLNTAFSYGLYTLFVYLGCSYAVASLLSLLLGIAFSFRTQGALVFGNREGRRIFRFAACWGVIYLINIGVISAFVRLGFNAYVAGALALVPVTLMSYFVQKSIVFSGPRVTSA